ncbi:short-chain dehydrogenase/reductase family 16C member 6-like [Diadema antillarum]|uniref:short-chain dehydrogenase/reductase family 16C member 6-like n=1 Tax=Diadema antillarum TaxID=105358 RepID=UPI003A869473
MFHHILDALVLLAKIMWANLKAIYRLFVQPPKVSVEGKVVLITGAGSGLGRELALRFAAAGARLVLWDISDSGNQATADLIKQAHPDKEVHLYQVDVSDKEGVKSTALRAQNEVGQVYMLINNAGVLVGETILELTEKEIERTIHVNAISQFWMVRAFLPAMLEADSGHIVTTCSTGGEGGMHRETDYCASKFAVFGFDESLERELKDVYKKSGIKQTLVCPHTMDTGLIHSIEQRFLGWSSVTEAADFIVDQVLRQARFVYFPRIYRYVSLGRGLLPYEARMAVMEFINIQVSSQKASKPHKE